MHKKRGGVGWQVSLVLLGFVLGTDAGDIAVVKKGIGTAVIVVDRQHAATGDKRRPATMDDVHAAEILSEWIEKITGTRLPITGEVPQNCPVFLIGRKAVEHGLDLKHVTCPSSEGLRVLTRGNQVLVAGEDGTSTVKAVCRLLEELGCRYFIDHPLGQVYPRTKDLNIPQLDLQEYPKVVYRRIWGSEWSGQTLWKVWNGAGGVNMKTGHAWASYITAEQLAQHPEWRALQDGERKGKGWLCTSNPELREAFAESLLRRVRAGDTCPSISPPDGTGYCQCERCVAQDVPGHIEPSSRRTCTTDRYLDFYQYLGNRVKAQNPNAILNFYCYADYTQPPARKHELPDDLCAWIAPIRYCRFHHIGHPGCPSRTQLTGLIDGWSEAVGRLGYRTYNYNLAECLVPFSKVSVWTHDIPYLAKLGCVGFNLESLANWQIYGPHMYLSIRLAYDPDADAGAVMDDYYRGLFGPQAAVHMKAYWETIDKRFSSLRCHTGSFYGVHLVYSPEFVVELTSLIEQARQAAGDDPARQARVTMFAEGLQNAGAYGELLDALRQGRIEDAGKIYETLLVRCERNASSKLGQAYTVRYLQRFVGKPLQTVRQTMAAPNRLVTVLGDRMRLAYDSDDRGVQAGFHQPRHDDTDWLEVATWSMPLNAQGLPDRQEIMWYRARFGGPEKLTGNYRLCFMEVDGIATVYLNGQQVFADAKPRTAFVADVGTALKSGENVLAVRVDHRRITELDLGGIIRPVYLVAVAPDAANGDENR